VEIKLISKMVPKIKGKTFHKDLADLKIAGFISILDNKYF
jgi:hypothetical protein